MQWFSVKPYCQGSGVKGGSTVSCRRQSTASGHGLSGSIFSVDGRKNIFLGESRRLVQPRVMFRALGEHP